MAQNPAGAAAHPTPMQATATSAGLSAHNDREQLELTVCSDAVIHVTARPLDGPAANAAQPWMLPQAQACPGAPFHFSQSGDSALLSTDKVAVALRLENGSLSFRSAQGGELVRERPNLPRTYAKSEAAKLYRIEDRFAPDATEALYGLGQHQSGMFNYRGSVVELGQNNTDIAVPLLVSSKGYALLWNTASFTYVDNRFPLELNFTSMAAPRIDYYFLYGPEMDGIVHAYRSMTGHVPLFPEWAYGFWQSKDRYDSQQKILAVAHEYRARHLPMDAIVQDWFWWKHDRKGDPEFNANITDIPEELKTLHAEHVHAMISVWAMMDAGSENFKQIAAQGYDIPGTQVYDPTNPKASDYFWDHLVGKLFAQGWDGFWLDSSEPKEAYPHSGDAVLRDKQLHIGPGLEYTNLFPMAHTGEVAQHWRAANPDKRVFILTRSAFLGQQRVGTTVWSGDVYSSWWALQHQVPAGLNFALSGFPYWTTDIGGYHLTDPGEADRPDYQELYARWFEYGAFCPVFRTHGHRNNNELWTYQQVFPTLVDFDKLRYRLLPYVYSLAWKVTHDDYTIQRPLVMDFRHDPATLNIGDEFMFGPALLVSPVLTEHTTAREVYLPGSGTWYDFWTGEQAQGGVRLEEQAPLDRIPVDVRAGSILPLGPEIEYAGQKTDPIELRIYPGADGAFSLYEDQGDSYAYQDGARSVIPMHWDDARRTLTLGARQGSYPGMSPGHTFRVVVVAPGHGTGGAVTAKPDRVVDYAGTALEIRF